MRYNTGGKEGGLVREVFPERWLNLGVSFFALCVRDGKIKQYRMDRIRQASTVPID